uniref:Transmembrane protein 179B n=2 Tax=Denticeps clupeoides TaxID=299321 RepID=A0AAY4ADU7_9TELE
MTMALPWLLVLELVLYAGCFICGIIAATSLTLTQGHFDGRCILYGSVYYNMSAQALALESSSSPSLCYFVSFISICVAIYCFCLLLYWIYSSCADEDPSRARLWLNISLLVCAVIVFFLVVSGCILRIGRNHLCLSVLHSLPSITECEEAQNETWISPYTGDHFYSGLHSAERSVWVNFFFWMLIIVVISVQRHHVSDFRGLGRDAAWSPDETQPFLRHPSRL